MNERKVTRGIALFVVSAAVAAACSSGSSNNGAQGGGNQDGAASSSGGASSGASGGGSGATSSGSGSGGAGSSGGSGAGASSGSADATVQDALAEAGREGSAASSGSSGGSGSSSGSTGALPPSCRAGGAGMTNCGASSESCCTSIEVPGGTFFRNYTNIASLDGGVGYESNPATLSGFRLDKYLVTVGRFRQFVSAWNGGSGYTPPSGSGKHTHLNGGQGVVDELDAGYEPGWLTSDNVNVAPTDSNLGCNRYQATWTSTAGTQENLPINCVTWQEAYAFCIWDDGFLPSEAEFGYAAGGGSQQREYPWGSADPGTASQYAIFNCLYPTRVDAGYCTDVSNIAPVGTATLGAGLWGHLDLSGEEQQWVLDYDDAYQDPCSDCADLSNLGGIYRVYRGSSYEMIKLYLPATYRDYYTPTMRNVAIGFRCARTP
jgi:formylglycine-generating enzyme required for sulfatase activity